MAKNSNSKISSIIFNLAVLVISCLIAYGVFDKTSNSIFAQLGFIAGVIYGLWCSLILLYMQIKMKVLAVKTALLLLLPLPFIFLLGLRNTEDFYIIRTIMNYMIIEALALSTATLYLYKLIRLK